MKRLEELKNKLEIVLEQIDNQEKELNELNSQRQELYEAIRMSNTIFSKRLEKELVLPETYKVENLNTYYSNELSFTLREYDKNNKSIFGSEMSIYYDKRKNRIGVNTGTMGTLWNTEEDSFRITHAEVYLKVLHSLDYLQTIIEEYLQSISLELNNISEINQKKYKIELSINRNKNVIKELNLFIYLLENNNILELSKPINVYFRNRNATLSNKVEVIKQLPKGDYKVKVTYKSLNYIEVNYDGYMTLNELQRLYNRIILDNKSSEQEVK